jgi:hypothetical protein
MWGNSRFLKNKVNVVINVVKGFFLIYLKPFDWDLDCVKRLFFLQTLEKVETQLNCIT